MKLLRNLGGMLSVALLLGLLMFSVPAGAQSLTALSLERSLTLSNILTTTPPPIPAATLAAITGGALDLREQLAFNSQSNTLTSTIFTVASGAPNPTNLASLPFNAFLTVNTANISQVVISSKPAPAVTIIGTIVSSVPGNALNGGVTTLSFAFSSDKPPKITNVIETLSGAIVLFSASAQGTVTIVQPPAGGGGGGAGITVMVNGSPVGASGATFQTVSSLFSLDASASTTSNAGATLKFSWALAPGSPSASINVNGTNPAKADVQFGAGKGTYLIQLTVSDSTGASSIVTLTIQFV